MAKALQSRGSPLIFVDAKKKEIVKNYKNAGQGWQQEGAPTEVTAYDFIDPRKGKSLQEFVNCEDIKRAMCHVPPGTNKWNKMNIGCFAISLKIGEENH